MDVLYHTLKGKIYPVQILLILLICNLIVSSDFAFSQENTKDKPVMRNAAQITLQKDKETLAATEVEIEEIQGELDWLVQKIKRMDESQRCIPQRMLDSIEFKKQKIMALNQLKNRIEEKLPQESRIEEKLSQKTAVQKPGFQTTVEGQLKKAGLSDWIEFSKNGTVLKLVNRLPILFASGSAAIAKEYQAVLNRLAGVVKGYDVRIIVNGYADVDPIQTAQYPSNFELGAARAASVVHVLEKYGVKPSVFKIGSTGKYRFSARKASQWKAFERHADVSIFFNDIDMP